MAEYNSGQLGKEEKLDIWEVVITNNIIIILELEIREIF
jgi:hypothetical protein